MPKLVRRIALLLVVILRPFDFHPAEAAIVSACDEAGLRAALLTGEPVTFGCDGTIVLSEAIAVTASVSLDGGGRDVKLSGGGNVRILQVGPGAAVRLRGLSLQDGFTRGAEGAPAGEGR